MSDTAKLIKLGFDFAEATWDRIPRWKNKLQFEFLLKQSRNIRLERGGPAPASPSETIGILLEGKYPAHEKPVSENLEKLLRDKSFGVDMIGHKETLPKFVAALEHWRSLPIGGLILMPPPMGSLAHVFVEYLCEQWRDIPIVCINSTLGEGIPCVVPDHVAGSLRAVERLIDYGYRQIIFVGRNFEARGIQLRQRGYEEAIRRSPPSVKPPFVLDIENIGRVERFLHRLHCEYDDVTGVAFFCANYQMARELHACVVSEWGSWPERTGLAHYDGPDLSGLPNAYGCRQQIPEMIEAAVTLLQKCKDNQPLDRTFVEIPTVLSQRIRALS